MPHDEPQVSKVKRFFSWVWRWTPHAVSVLGTAGLTIGAVLLGSGDYGDLSKATKIWGWSLLGAGIGLTGFTTILLGFREKSRAKLRGKVDRANGRAARAEDLVGALSRALQEGMRSRLLHIEDDLEIKEGTEFRITLYSHKKRDQVLIRRARYSRNHTLDDPRYGRTTIPDDEGLIGRALAQAKASVFTVRMERGQESSRPAWLNWMVTDGHLTSTVAGNLRMQTYHFMFAPITDSSVGRTVGILVVEFEKASAAPSAAKLNDSIVVRGRDLAVALAAIERELELTHSDDPGREVGASDGELV